VPTQAIGVKYLPGSRKKGWINRKIDLQIGLAWAVLLCYLMTSVEYSAPPLENEVNFKEKRNSPMRGTKSELIDQVSDLVESILVPGKLVSKVLSVVVNLSSSERGAVFVLSNGNRLDLRATAGSNVSDLNAVRDVCNNYLSDLTKAPSVIYVADTRKDERFRKVSILKSSEILSFVIVPLRVEGTLYGVMYLDSTIAARLFSSLDLDRITRYAKLITNAMIREHRLPETDIRVPSVSVNDYLAERTIDEIERQQLSAILERHNWNVTRTSQAMDVPRRTLYNKMTKHGIRRPRRGKLAISALAG
jgi:transcriptional regulator with GAF, ATPase, and Fis domain